MTRDEKIRHLREHLEKRKRLQNMWVSVDGLQALFAQLDELKAQVERLMTKDVERIKRELVAQTKR